MNKKTPNILVSTTEASGDLHAAALINEIKKLSPQIEFLGMGSQKMRDARVKIEIDSSGKGAVGLLEALPKAVPLYFIFKKMVSLLDSQKPDAVLLVDSQGFNLPLAKEAKKRGIKTIYYIAPQEWLWGTPAGVKKVVDAVDLIIAIFAPEAEAYKKAGANVFYHGHPLLDLVKPALSREEARQTFSIKDGQKVISIFPGNRGQEIKDVFPIMLEAAKSIQYPVPSSQEGKTKTIIPLYSDFYLKEVEEQVKKSKIKADIVIGKNHDVINISDLVLCSPGTVTVESAILGVPSIAIYRLNPLTYFTGKYVVKIGLKYFSMVNILNNKEIIPEFIQKNAAPSKIAAEAREILSADKGLWQERLKEAIKPLGQKGAVLAGAKAVLDFCVK